MQTLLFKKYHLISGGIVRQNMAFLHSYKISRKIQILTNFQIGQELFNYLNTKEDCSKLASLHKCILINI